MPADDDSALLPSPPPPRPAARDTAIAAAMRRFDGIANDSVASSKPSRSSWTRKPQFGLLVAASLVGLLGIPAALIALRNGDADSGRERGAPPRVVTQPRHEPVAPPASMAPPKLTQATQEPAIAPPVRRRDVAISGEAPPLASERDEGGGEEKVADAIAPPVVAAAPPPPPPPPAPTFAQKSANEAIADDVVVTGSLMRAPKSAARAEGYAPSAPDWVLKDGAYAAFLTKLQTAVRADDRAAVVALVAFPLRVNSGGRSRLYRDAAAVRRDYDAIFTPRVRSAILGQRFDRLFGRDQGVMIGDGEVWFDHVSASGPVRIKSINR